MAKYPLLGGGRAQFYDTFADFISPQIEGQLAFALDTGDFYYFVSGVWTLYGNAIVSGINSVSGVLPIIVDNSTPTDPVINLDFPLAIAYGGTNNDTFGDGGIIFHKNGTAAHENETGLKWDYLNGALQVGGLPSEFWGTTPTHYIALNDGIFAFQGLNNSGGGASSFLAIGRGALASSVANINAVMSGTTCKVLAIGFDQTLSGFSSDWALHIGDNQINTGDGNLSVGHYNYSMGSQNFLFCNSGGVINGLGGITTANTIMGGYGSYIYDGAYNIISGYGNGIGSGSAQTDMNLIVGNFNGISSGITGVIALGTYINGANSINESNTFFAGGDAGLLGYNSSIIDAYFGSGKISGLPNSDFHLRTTGSDSTATDGIGTNFNYHCGIPSGAGVVGGHYWWTPDQGTAASSVHPQTETVKMFMSQTGQLGIFQSISAVDASAIFELQSTTLGALFPRMSRSERDAIVSPAVGLWVYNIDDVEFDFWDGAAWTAVGGGGSGTIAGTIASTQVAFGTAADTIGGDPAFIYDSGLGVLTVPLVETTTVKAPSGSDLVLYAQTSGKRIIFFDQVSGKTATMVTTALSANRTFTWPDATGTIAVLTATQTFQNKTLDNTNTVLLLDSLFRLEDNVDNTKRANFDCANISTATTRTFNFPDVSDTLVTLTATQTLTNKTITINDTLFTLQDDGDTTKKAKFELSSITTGTTRTYTLPDITGIVAMTTGTQTITNKTLDNTNTITVLDSRLTIQDNGDNTKQALFEASGITTGTTRTYTLPNANGTLALTTDIDNAKIVTLTYIFDGGGSTLTTGIKGDLEVPFACTINRATLLSDQSGSIVIDIWKDTYANYPPTVADTITASAKPTISATTKAQDATLTGWTTSITAGDTLRFNIDSVTSCQRVTLSLKCTKT